MPPRRTTPTDDFQVNHAALPSGLRLQGPGGVGESMVLPLEDHEPLAVARRLEAEHGRLAVSLACLLHLSQACFTRVLVSGDRLTSTLLLQEQCASALSAARGLPWAQVVSARSALEAVGSSVGRSRRG